MGETLFKRESLKRLETILPGCIILRGDSRYLQGIPDIVVLYRANWAALEYKDHLNAPYQPNQEYYLERMGNMSFAAMVCPENEEAVFYDLQRSFGFVRPTCLSESQ